MHLEEEKRTELDKRQGEFRKVGKLEKLENSLELFDWPNRRRWLSFRLNFFATKSLFVDKPAGGFFENISGAFPESLASQVRPGLVA